MSCLYILEINPLSIVSFAIIFSHSEGCLFTLLLVSFTVQKLLSLIRSHLFTLVFILHLEKAMAPHSSTLAWKNPMDGGAWWAAVHGVAKSRTRLSDFTFTFHFHTLEKEMATCSSVLAWRIPGTGKPGGLLSMGSQRVRHNWIYLAAAATANPLHGTRAT